MYMRENRCESIALCFLLLWIKVKSDNRWIDERKERWMDEYLNGKQIKAKDYQTTLEVLLEIRLS